MPRVKQKKTLEEIPVQENGQGGGRSCGVHRPWCQPVRRRRREGRKENREKGKKGRCVLNCHTVLKKFAEALQVKVLLEKSHVSQEWVCLSGPTTPSHWLGAAPWEVLSQGKCNNGLQHAAAGAVNQLPFLQSDSWEARSPGHLLIIPKTLWRGIHCLHL